jgi:hypothetical protein
VEPVPTPYNQGAILMSDMINDLLDGNSKFVSGEFLPNENYYHAIAANKVSDYHLFPGTMPGLRRHSHRRISGFQQDPAIADEPSVPPKICEKCVKRLHGDRSITTAILDKPDGNVMVD